MLASKFPPNVLNTISFAITCQELNEFLRDGHNNELGHSNLAGALILVVKTCFTTNLNYQTSSLSSLREIDHVLSCIHETLRNLQDQAPNFYGTFRKEIPLKHLLWLSEHLKKLAHQLSSDVEEKAYSMDDDKSHKITNILSRIFWLRHFDRNLIEVSWERFMDCFNEDYGIQPPRAVAILKKEFVTNLYNSNHESHGGEGISGGSESDLSNQTDDVEDDIEHPRMIDEDNEIIVRRSSNATDMVNVYTYEKLTKDCGLYQKYQLLCDPITVVYEMGTVEDNSSKVVPLPTLVGGLLGLSIKQICCGGQHAAVLTHEGVVHTWGRGGFGRLGHGRTDTVDYPREVESLKKIKCVQIACGFAYTASVTAEGVLYTWGAGENGRLGLGDVEDRHVPSRVDDLLPFPVEQVYAGSVHTCVLTRQGQVFSFGKHEYTGHGSDLSDVLIPKLLDSFGDKVVAQISVGPGGYHTIALTTDGEVFTWGHNRVGQLGYSNGDMSKRNGEGAHFIPVPRIVNYLRQFEVKQVVAGWGHTAVLTKRGEVLICGRNLQGQLGLGDPNNFPRNEREHPYQAHFIPIPTLSHCRIKQIACGGEHSVALGVDNCVYTFGAGNKGQLGHACPKGTRAEDFELASQSEYVPKLVSSIRDTRRDIHQVACGNNCTLILAGCFNPPSLMDKCIEVIAETPELIEQLEYLPLELSALVRRSLSTL